MYRPAGEWGSLAGLSRVQGSGFRVQGESRMTTETAAAIGVKAEIRKCAESAMGLLTLKRPAQLNALSLEMIQSLQAQLDAWREDDSIALVVVAAEGQRAFCAGADIRQIFALTDARFTLTMLAIWGPSPG